MLKARPIQDYVFHLILFMVCLLTTGFVTHGQNPGHLTGTIRVASGAPVPGVQVVVTNQVTARWKRTRSNAQGQYSFRLAPGAYRLKLGGRHIARFEKDQKYGEFAIPRGDVLENVIVETARETVIDIPLDLAEVEEIPRQPGDKPTGHAGQETVSSEPQTDPTKREARDRWRIGDDARRQIAA